MALIIGVRRGTEVQVHDQTLTVKSVDHAELVTVNVGGKTHSVTAKQRLEVVPNVYLSLGGQPRDPHAARLAFEAPRSITITRLR